MSDIKTRALPADPIVRFFSDSHFGAEDRASERPRIEAFVEFVDDALANDIELFFLGDLFNFWLEHRHWVPRVPFPVLAAIDRYVRTGSRPFHLLIGNHDCWGRDYLQEELGVTVHPGDIEIERHGLRILLSHGDGKAVSDGGYRKLKRLLRFPPAVWAYRHLPADWGWRLAGFVSGHSRDLTGRRIPKFETEYRAWADRRLADGCDAVVMGHLHKPILEQRPDGWYVNSGEWIRRLSFIELADSRFRLRYWGDGCPPQAGR